MTLRLSGSRPVLIIWNNSMNLQDPVLADDFHYLLTRAIAEDIADEGDITGMAIFSGQNSRARIYSRQWGVISGLACVERSFRLINPRRALKCTCFVTDGDEVEEEQPIMELQALVTALLRTERIALNFLGLFSGIATTTRLHSRALAHSSTKLLDTRKTLPAYRRLSKAAVVDGGGSNHRMGLYDMVMIKDNHIKAAGSITKAVEKVRATWSQRYCIEVECRNKEEVREALGLSIDRIMLDNMTYRECQQALELRKQLCGEPNGESFPAFEASGDFTVEKIRHFSDLNLDYISVGGLTHSVMNHNLSMRFE